MALQGNIDSFSVVDVLRLLGSSAKTGRLVIDGDRGSASLWLEAGLLVSGSTAPTGRQAVLADPSEVLFDVLRYADGAFVFEAGIETGDRVGPFDVEPVIALASEAMGEWDEIVTVVPSAVARLQLNDELPDVTVGLDQRLWSGVCAIAWSAPGRHGASTVDTLAAHLGMGELPAMRLARDLAVLGLVSVADDATDSFGEPSPYDPLAAPAFESAFGDTPFESSSFGDAFDAAPFNPAPFEPAAFEPAAFEPAGFEPATFEPVGFDQVPPAFDAGQFDPGSFERTDPVEEESLISDLVADIAVADVLSTDEPLPVTGPYVADEVAAPPTFNAESDDVTVPAEVDPTAAELNSIFGAFDPFGTTPLPTDEPGDQSPGAGDVDPVDEATRQADMARQLAMLSPRAAEAVASADAGLSSEDEERARVARFLGSV